MVRIAYILTPITFGGSEKVSLNFLKHVDRRRYHIKPILLIRPWEDEPYFARELRRYGYRFESVPVAVRRTIDPIRVPRVAARLFAILRKGAFHLVHTHGYFADICGQPAARLLGIPGISTCHGYISTNGNLKLYNMLDKKALRLSRKIIAVSRDIRDELLQSGIESDRIEVVQNACGNGLGEDEIIRLRMDRRSALGIGEEEFVLGFAGRISEEKGLRHLVAAVSEMRSHGKPIKLVILGDGPERGILSGLVRGEGLQEQVVFAGFRENSEEWFCAFDVFVLPSLSEGTPMALIEAMSLGIPVVASAVGGVPDVIDDGTNGFLVPPGESRELSRRIQQLMDDEGLRKRLSRAGRDMVTRRYNVLDWSRTIERMYDSLAVDQVPGGLS